MKGTSQIMIFRWVPSRERIWSNPVVFMISLTVSAAPIIFTGPFLPSSIMSVSRPMRYTQDLFHQSLRRRNLFTYKTESPQKLRIIRRRKDVIPSNENRRNDLRLLQCDMANGVCGFRDMFFSCCRFARSGKQIRRAARSSAYTAYTVPIRCKECSPAGAPGRTNPGAFDPC